MFVPYEKKYRVKGKKDGAICCKCGAKDVVNKFHKLCKACNDVRLHGENTTSSVIKKLPFFSEKGKQRDEALKATRAAVLKKALDSNSLHCAGCGCVSGLTNSHILSKALRPDLFDVVDNLQLLCYGCHHIYEHGTIEEKCNLKSFVDACKYIFQNDMPRFEAILDKLSDAYQKTGDKNIEGVMAKLERFD